ncbi:MAG: hypothetical protein ACRCZ2_02975 [Fusobacteriaceae bacterium]
MKIFRVVDRKDNLVFEGSNKDYKYLCDTNGFQTFGDLEEDRYNNEFYFGDSSDYIVDYTTTVPAYELMTFEGSLIELDDKMMDLGYYTVFNGSLTDILETKNVAYTESTPERIEVLIEFEIIEECDDNKGWTQVKVVDVYAL